MKELLEQSTECVFKVDQTRIVPDEESQIQRTILEWVDEKNLALAITTGGTGFATRDITPEAIEKLLHRKAPGLTQAMINYSLQKTPLAVLSRPIAGTRKNTLIITVPGSPKGAKENIEAILPVLSHALRLVGGEASRQVHAESGLHVIPAQSRGGGADQTHHNGHHHHGHGHRAPRPHTDAGATDTAVSRRARKSPYPMIPVKEALDRIFANSSTLPAVSISLDPHSTTLPRYIGSVLAEDVVAKEQVPGYRASLVDGYAVIASDGKGTYPVIGSSSAKPSPAASTLTAANIMRITTGAPLPQGANAVVMVEDTVLIEEKDGEELKVEILAHVTENENIREPGSDVAIGDIVGRKGEIILRTGAEIGSFASVGIKNIQVYRKPTVAILSTGNEVVSHLQEGDLQYGQIRDSNRPALHTAIQSLGFDVVDLGVSLDTHDALESSLRDGVGKADVIISTGGVSMGELDLLKPIIQQRLGGKIHFGRVTMKPGKPTTFATLGDKLIFALPGNPASAIVTFHLFVLPALRKMAGYQQPELPRLKVHLGHAVKLDSRPEYHRAILTIEQNAEGSNKFIAHSTGYQRSSRMLSLRGANALLELPAKTSGDLKEGDIVNAMLISDL